MLSVVAKYLVVIFCLLQFACSGGGGEADTTTEAAAETEATAEESGSEAPQSEAENTNENQETSEQPPTAEQPAPTESTNENENPSATPTETIEESPAPSPEAEQTTEENQPPPEGEQPEENESSPEEEQPAGESETSPGEETPVGEQPEGEEPVSEPREELPPIESGPFSYQITIDGIGESEHVGVDATPYSSVLLYENTDTFITAKDLTSAGNVEIETQYNLPNLVIAYARTGYRFSGNEHKSLVIENYEQLTTTNIKRTLGYFHQSPLAKACYEKPSSQQVTIENWPEEAHELVIFPGYQSVTDEQETPVGASITVSAYQRCAENDETADFSIAVFSGNHLIEQDDAPSILAAGVFELLPSIQDTWYVQLSSPVTQTTFENLSGTPISAITASQYTANQWLGLRFPILVRSPSNPHVVNVPIAPKLSSGLVSYGIESNQMAITHIAKAIPDQVQLATPNIQIESAQWQNQKFTWNIPSSNEIIDGLELWVEMSGGSEFNKLYWRALIPPTTNEWQFPLLNEKYETILANEFATRTDTSISAYITAFAISDVSNYAEFLDYQAYKTTPTERVIKTAVSEITFKLSSGQTSP